MDSTAGPGKATSIGVIKKKQNRKVINPSWLQVEQFKCWLNPTLNDEGKAVCLACDIAITNHKSTLVRHSTSSQHLEALFKKNRSNSSLPSTSDISSYASSQARINFKAHDAEMRISAFIADHNLPISILDDLIPLFKDIFSDPEASINLSLPRNECSNIIVNALAKRELDDTIQILKHSKFSVFVDESTTIANDKLLCVVVKFLAPDRKIQTKLLQLIKLDLINCSSEKLFQAFESFFTNNKIPLSNIISLSSDNAHLMDGDNNSFLTRLLSKNPKLIVIKCICHSLALIASKACAQLPADCIKLLHSVGSYFSITSKRSAQLVEFQKHYKLIEQNILEVSETRWLSMYNCIDRILNNWLPLKEFFKLEAEAAAEEDDPDENINSDTTKKPVEKRLSVKEIFACFSDGEIRSYLYFLKFNLNSFNNFNATFQSRETLIHCLSERIEEFLTQMGTRFLKKSVLDNITASTIVEENFLPLSSVYVGRECQNCLQTLPPQIIENIKSNCLAFYTTVASKILKELPFRQSFFVNIKILKSDIALSSEARVLFPNLDELSIQFNLMEISDLVTKEWLLLPEFFELPEKFELSRLSMENMWSTILAAKDESGTLLFSNLAHVINAILIIPLFINR